MSDVATMLAALGLPSVLSEPEVIAADLGRIQSKSLATLIAALVNEHEPLLKAEASDNEITVTERGGQASFSVTVQPSHGSKGPEAGNSLRRNS